jgi:thioredoxin 1
MSTEHVFTDDNFEQDLKENVALVDFWAPWCAPCRLMGPVVENLAEKFNGKAVVGKMNVEEHKGVAGKLGIRAIPTLILFKDGQEVQRFQGVQSEDTLTGALNGILSNN